MFFVDLQKIWDGILSVVMAILGALVRLLNMKEEKRMAWRRIIAELFTASVTGLITYLVASAMGYKGELVGALCGGVGLAGQKAVIGLLEVIQKRTGIRLLDADEKKEG